LPFHVISTPTMSAAAKPVAKSLVSWDENANRETSAATIATHASPRKILLFLLIPAS
jgi:hypothetical protein